MASLQRAQTAHLREAFASAGAPHRVDREKGVIYGVKIAGFASPNNHSLPGVTGGTTYTREALQNAVPLYEGAAVSKDHPDRRTAGEVRKIGESFGWLTGVHVTDEGMFGDLNLLVSDPDAVKLLEAAEKNPALFALSHHAAGEWTLRGGKAVIHRIPKVWGVDVVTKGGSNATLFEGKYEDCVQDVKKKGGAVNPFAVCHASVKEDCPQCERKQMAYEQDEQGMPPVEAPAEPIESDPRKKLGEVVGMLAQSADPADHDLAAKIMKLLKPEEVAAPVEEGEDAELNKDREEKEEGKGLLTESCEKTQPEDPREREIAVLQEALEAKIDLTPARKKALMAVDAADRAALVEEFKTKKSGAKSVAVLQESAPVDLYADGLYRLTGRKGN